MSKSKFLKSSLAAVLVTASLAQGTAAGANGNLFSGKLFLTLITHPTPGPCKTAQTSFPEDGRWSFILNFDTVAPLQGCLIDRTQPGKTTLSIVTCQISAAQGVVFVSDGERQWARFDGTGGGVLCPNFDPPGAVTAQREYKSLVAVARPMQAPAVRRNPLLYHPSSALPGALPDLSYRMPVSPTQNGALVGLVTEMTPTKSFTTSTGALINEWNVLSSIMTRQAPYVLTHTLNAGNVMTFSPGPLFFNFTPVTLSIGLNPVTGESFWGDIDELILDPRSGVGG